MRRQLEINLEMRHVQLGLSEIGALGPSHTSACMRMLGGLKAGRCTSRLRTSQHALTLVRPSSKQNL